MTYILNGDLANPIEDTAPFVGSDGTHYPWNWDKSTVLGMVQVIETTRPDETQNRVTGSHVELVGGVPTRVWDYIPKTAQDLKARANAPILAQLERKDRLTDRRVREMVLRWAQSALPANDPDRIALEAREVEFAALRGTLTP